jgi:pimeloyl-ACP methyl ester carboxylesterase
MRKSLRVILIIIGLLVIITGSFVVWGETTAKPMPQAFAALQSDTQVTVTTGKWLEFTPSTSAPKIGFVIYPGGRVDYRAYAPQAYSVAAHGYLVVIIHMPLNLAVFDPSAAAAVISRHPEIKIWAVGGHSLGGAMAASFAHSNPDSVRGLVLWASYPAGRDDLSQSDIKVISISGMLDGLSTPDKITASQKLLPADTIWVPIVGGNHAQFGWYGPQAGDNPATISREEQQAQIVQATVDFLTTLKQE